MDVVKIQYLLNKVSHAAQAAGMMFCQNLLFCTLIPCLLQVVWCSCNIALFPVLLVTCKLTLTAV